MKIFILFAAILLVALYLSGTGFSEGKDQALCPVKGDEISKDIFTDHEGQRIYFSEQSSVDVFKNDPDKYLKVLKDQGVRAEAAPGFEAPKSCWKG